MENKEGVKTEVELGVSVDPKTKILAALKNQPGQKARELSFVLDINKKDINSILYGELKDRCVQDEKYCWYLNEDAPNKRKDSEKAVSPTALTNLAHYYLSCLGRDDEGGLSVFADNKYGDLDYAELKNLPLNEDDSLFESDTVQKLLGKIRRDRGRLEMYLGYPSTLKEVHSKKSNWVGFFVEPILLFPIETSSGSPKMSRGFPIVNISVLKRFTNAEREQVMDELVQLEEELGLTSDGDIPEIDDLVKRLSSIREEWPWKEVMEPNSLPGEPSLRTIREEGIYNRAVLIVGERSPFTQGLETELKSLADLPSSQYENTVLGQWIKGGVPKEDALVSLPLLEVLVLNSEQRQAVHHSLSKPLTVITGPPGTGKSQIVTNLLLNAVWHGKKVLFASKNNKAVDVVEARLNNLGARPILLRMGSNLYQTKLAEYLIGLLTATSTEHDQEEFDFDLKRYKQLEEKYTELERQERELIRLRNEVDELDQSIEKFRKDVSEDVFNKLSTINISDLRVSVRPFLDAYKNAIKKNQGFLIRLAWEILKEGRYRKLMSKIEGIKQTAASFEIDCPSSIPGDETIEEWKAVSEKLESYFAYKQYMAEYAESFKLLQKARPLEDISREKIELIERMANNAESLWKGWLRLQPSRLSSEDRQLLNRYNALLKMVIDAGGDLYTKLGKKVYREYSNLSKSVSHLLPAWAVTSLSARGKIPFDPGYFDIVVFDEASQCDIASALPLLYRGKQVVVIGDPKQLSHISGLQRGQDQQLLEKHKLIPDFAHWAYSYNSLFDLASGLVSGNDIINLRDHHRSHADIIEFSNKEFYEGNLRIATNYDRLKFVDSRKNGVRWKNVVGNVMRPAVGGAINEIEAKEVVKELRRLVLEQGYKGSIGAVTPFRAQANLIQQLKNDDKDLSVELINHDFLVDTVHKFQGDERDVMIFSPVVSRNMPAGALIFMKNNGNLFNVAITRARALLLVVGDQNAIVNCNISYLKNFAIYAQQLEEKKEKQIETSVEDLGADYPTVSQPERVSEWEHMFYKALYQAGIRTIPQYQVEKYALDLALFDGKRMIDIEVDGERYHRNWTGELCRRDQIRNQRLFELGWDVMRFWVYQIRDDMPACIERVKKWIAKSSEFQGHIT